MEPKIVFSKTVSTGQAVEAVVTAVEMISSSGDDVPVRLAVEKNEYNKAHQVFRCAQIIRGELLAVRNTMAWPPTSEDLAENNDDISDLVYNLLAWVLYGDSGDEAVSDEKLSLSDTNNRHVMLITRRYAACCFEWQGEDAQTRSTTADGEAPDEKFTAG